jgi:hypothetical protein
MPSAQLGSAPASGELNIARGEASGNRSSIAEALQDEGMPSPQLGSEAVSGERNIAPGEASRNHSGVADAGLPASTGSPKELPRVAPTENAHAAQESVGDEAGPAQEPDSGRESSDTAPVENRTEGATGAGECPSGQLPAILLDSTPAAPDQKPTSEAEIDTKLKEWLQKHGYTDVNCRRKRLLKYKYPLHTAVKNNDVEMVQLLLQSGSCHSNTNSSGLTPKQLAARSDKDGTYAAIIAALP